MEVPAQLVLGQRTGKRKAHAVVGIPSLVFWHPYAIVYDLEHQLVCAALLHVQVHGSAHLRGKGMAQAVPEQFVDDEPAGDGLVPEYGDIGLEVGGYFYPVLGRV